MAWLWLVLGIASNALASVLIKIAVTPPRKFLPLDDPLGALSNVYLWLGLMSFGIAFIFYAMVLNHFPLHVAHPILNSGTIVCVVMASMLVLRETFSLTTLLGIALVMVGVILIGLKQTP